MNSNKKSLKTVGIAAISFAVILLVVVGIIQLTKGTASGELVIKGDGKIVALKCIDNTLTHPTLTRVKPVSFSNTITANFNENVLSSIMYRYDGVYESESAADGARDTGGVDYDLIMTREYGEEPSIFSNTFSVNGAKMSATITAKSGKVSSRTAPMFFLDAQQPFPKNIENMKSAYEAKDFSCQIVN